VLSAGAFAQVKTDGLWRGMAGAALLATSGNTSGTSLLLNADFSRATESDKISLGGMVNYPVFIRPKPLRAHRSAPSAASSRPRA
jgi:hypothetical protein